MGLQVFLLFLVAQQPTPGEAGDYIFGGTPVPNGASSRFEWLVSLENKNGQHFCAGTYIGNNRIATAEHCMVLNEPKPWYAVFNKTTEDDQGGIRKRLSHYFTPGNAPMFPGPFNPNKSDYAEAVFEEEAPSGISPIEICPKSLQLQNGTSVKAVGWGDEGKKNDSKNLNEVDLELALTGSRNFIFTNTVYDGVGKTTCRGDSGGPLLLKQNEAATFCLLGTVAGSYGGDNLLDKLCRGLEDYDQNQIDNEIHKAFWNFVPEKTSTLQNSKNELCWTVSREC